MFSMPHAIVESDPLDSERARQLKSIGWVSYLLHLVVAIAGVIPGAQVGASLLVIALAIDLFKRADARGTWQESHFAWRLRSVVAAGVLYVVTAPLFLLLYFPGAVAWALISVWFLYRIVRGAIAMRDDRSVGD
jgi:uncharacterized membrane protein